MERVKRRERERKRAEQNSGTYMGDVGKGVDEGLDEGDSAEEDVVEADLLHKARRGEGGSQEESAERKAGKRGGGIGMVKGEKHTW